MPKNSDDSPYAESTARGAARSGHKAPAKPVAKPTAKPTARPAKRPVEKARHASSKPAASAPSARKRRRGRGGGGAAAKVGAKSAPRRGGHGLTSHPTSRGAMTDTRAWLLEQYGPFCAYCGLKFPPRAMTLDHVAPRRGQTAYDRRDNLVLACSDCNAKKRDQSPLAFLLAVRSRAANLLKYGSHLSAGLIDLVSPLAGRIRYNSDADDHGPSPYKD